jgi:hypothetical protein
MRQVGILLGLALMIGMTGCAMNSDLPSDPKDRILFVKTQAQEAENKAARLIPDTARTDVKQIDEGTLLSCSGGRQWSGNIKVQLSDPSTGASVLDDLGREASEHGFTVSRNTTADGAPRLRLVDEHGTTLLAAVWVDGKSIDFDSFSKCFSLPDDFVPHGSY